MDARILGHWTCDSITVTTFKASQSLIYITPCEPVAQCSAVLRRRMNVWFAMHLNRPS